MNIDIDRLAIDTIRTLSMDAVQKAGSGHPGAPMGLAPVAYTLWQRALRYDPADPLWPDRDRFVLSCGHASMLLYSLLHLAGVAGRTREGRPSARAAVPLEEIERFRQLGSACPGHPEHGHTTGVETTTGPLGQGLGNSVGMAIARNWLAARYSRPDFALFQHRVFALCGDGDLMEGVAHEAASLAGHLKLDGLCWIYDSNRITIEGSTDLAFSEDVAARFTALGWSVAKVADANDTVALARELEVFERGTGCPHLIVVSSQIGYGAPRKQGTAHAHGEPLGAEEVAGAKRAYGWPVERQFLVPAGVRERFTELLGARGARLNAQWQGLLARYAGQHPQAAAELRTLLAGDLPAGWEEGLPVFAADAKGLATRDASGRALNALAPRIPWLLGGSADLAPSNKSRLTAEGSGDLSAQEHGARNLHFGIREHAMAAICNGLALSGLRPFAATFLVFADYLKPALRLTALMELPVTYVLTHDSIGVGEDGPTHQPIEQLAMLRATPNTLVIRPADANETVEAWKVALTSRHCPVVLALTRQALPTIDRRGRGAASGLQRGGYVLSEAAGGAPQLILIGTGSEVELCLQAQQRLHQEGIAARVVSLPSWELFARQPQSWRDEVLPPSVTARVAVEAACGFGWERWTGAGGAVIALTGWGASAPLPALLEHFGFTVERVVDAARAQLALAAAPMSGS